MQRYLLDFAIMFNLYNQLEIFGSLYIAVPFNHYQRFLVRGRGLGTFYVYFPGMLGAGLNKATT